MADQPLIVIERILPLLIGVLLFATLPDDTAQASIVFATDRLTVTGDPTPIEATEITLEWTRMRDAFPALNDCVHPLTVVVVETAEAAWSGGSISGIAAFYRRSEETVYIEHGKVRAEHLIHEFAHHFDFSCGFGSSSLGAAFLNLQGFDADHPWARGSSWRDVPAEHFAEAVIGYMGIDSADLPVTPEALALVSRFAATGFALTPALAALRRPVA